MASHHSDDSWVGLNPPFLVTSHKNLNIKRCNPVLERECASFAVLDSEITRGCNITAIIYSDHCKIVKKIKLGDPIILFSCFDEIHLIFTSKNDGIKHNQESCNFCSQDNIKCFYTQFKCCRNWDVTKIKANAINFDCEVLSQYIEVPILISNCRPEGSYHYNVCQSNKSVKPFNLIFNGKEITLLRFQCPICFLIHFTEDGFIDHVKNFHIKFDLKKELNIFELTANKYQPAQSDNIKFTEKDNFDPYDNDFSFVSDYFEQEFDSNDSFCFNFCLGISVETPGENNQSCNSRELAIVGKNKEFKLNTDSLKLLKDMNKTFTPNMQYYPVSSPRELVQSLSTQRNKSKTSGTTMDIDVFFIQQQDFNNKKAFKNFNNNHRCLLTAIFDQQNYFTEKNLKKSNKNFCFLKKRNTKLINYSLMNYGLLIEEEYDKLDSSDALKNHLNERIHRLFQNKQLNRYTYEIMSTWNELMIKEQSLEECIYKLFVMFGPSGEFFQIIDLLYKRNLLTPSAISKIFSISENPQ